MANEEIGSAYVSLRARSDKLVGDAKKALGSSKMTKAAESSGASMGSGMGSGLAGSLKKFVAGYAFAKIGAAAGSAMMGGVKEALSAYADYEQLTGGVEKLFGESASQLMEYANQAYKTAGLSANDYMETVTSFSASLIGSLEGDTAAAVGYADMAIADMSDNANTFGTDMASIQNAYQGFAKQNYTMLDNLKLGYGGTKEEMQRLIDDANAVKEANGEMADLSIDSFADIVEAIHIVQTEQGIMGTTAKEAAGTIEGSIGMTQAAWQNLMIGLANPDADLAELTSKFTEALGYLVENITPRLETIGNAVAEVLPMLVESILPIVSSMLQKLVPIIIDVLPSLINAASDVITTLCDYLPQLIPLLISGAFQLFSALVQGVIDNGPEILAAVKQTLLDICSEVLGGEGYFTSFKNVGLYLLNALKVGAMEQLGVFENKIRAIPGEVATWIEGNQDAIYQKGVAMLGGFVEGILFKRAELAGWAVNLVADVLGWIGDNWTEVEARGSDIINGLITGVNAVMENLSAIFQHIVTSVAGWVAEGNLHELIDKGGEFIGSIVSGVTQGASDLVTMFTGLAGDVVTWIGDHWDEITAKGGEIIGAVISGVTSGAGDLVTMFTGLLGDVVTWIGEGNLQELVDKGFELIGGFFSGIMGAITGDGMEGGEGIQSMFEGLPDDIVGWIGDTLFTLGSQGHDLLTGFYVGISELLNGTFKDDMSGFLETVAGFIGSAVNTLFTLGWDFISGFITGAENKEDVDGATFFGGLLDLIKRIITTGIDVATFLGEIGTSLISGFLDGVTGGKWTEIKEWFAALPDSVSKEIGELGDKIKGKGEDLINGFLNGVKEIFGIDLTQPDSVLKFVQSIPDKIVQFIGNLGDTLSQKGKDLLNGFLDGIMAIFGVDETTAGSLLNMVHDIPQKIIDTLGNLGETLWQSGADLVSGFKEGIEAFMDDPIGTLADGVSQLIGGTEDQLDENSPSKVFEGIGKNLVLGLDQGIDGEKDTPDSTLTGIAGGLPGNFVDAYWQMHDQGVALMTSFGTGLSNAFYGYGGVGSVVSSLSTIGGSIPSYFTAGYYTLYGAGQQIMLGLNDGIVSIWNNTIIPNLQTITANIPNWKGPLDKDRHLLEDNGKAIMDGLMSGIESGARKVHDVLYDLTEMIPQDMMVSQTIDGSIASGASTRSVAPINITITGNELNVRDDDDIERIAEKLGDYITRSQPFGSGEYAA